MNMKAGYINWVRDLWESGMGEKNKELPIKKNLVTRYEFIWINQWQTGQNNENGGRNNLNES